MHLIKKWSDFVTYFLTSDKLRSSSKKKKIENLEGSEWGGSPKIEGSLGFIISMCWLKNEMTSTCLASDKPFLLTTHFYSFPSIYRTNPFFPIPPHTLSITPNFLLSIFSSLSPTLIFFFVLSFLIYFLFLFSFSFFHHGFSRCHSYSPWNHRWGCSKF